MFLYWETPAFTETTSGFGPKGDSDVDDEQTDERVDSLWVWSLDDPSASPTYLHEYCSLNPFDVTDEIPFMLDLGTEPKSRLSRASGRVLTYAFRHAPVLVVAALVVLTVEAAVTELYGLEVLVPGQVGPVTIGLASTLVLWLAIILLIAYIFSTADGDEELRAMTIELVHAGVFYGVLVLLLVGAAWSAWTVHVTPIEELRPNIVYSFGFLLLVYVGGPLVFDGMRRTETLFTELDETDLLRTDSDVSVFERDFLSRFRDAFAIEVGNTPAVLLASVLFVAQFVGIWLLSRGPFVLDTATTVVIVTAIDVAIVILAVQFVLLVRFLNELLTDSGLTLRYIPGHEDDAGGFRDFGRFATRVNSLLVLAGGYLIYRLHVQGSRDPLSPGTEATVTAVDSIIWAMGYAVPVAVYGAVIGIWLYFSFWQIHQKMVRDKRQQIQRERSPEGRSREDIETLQTYREAPEWPINDRLLVTVLSIDAISVLLSLLSLA